MDHFDGTQGNSFLLHDDEAVALLVVINKVTKPYRLFFVSGQPRPQVNIENVQALELNFPDSIP